MENEIEKLKVLIEHHKQIVMELENKLFDLEVKQKVDNYLFKDFENIDFIKTKATPPCDL